MAALLRDSEELKLEAERIEVVSIKSITGRAVSDSECPIPEMTPELERKLYRKIDMWLMPVLTIMYLFSFLDRGNIGNAKLDGLVTQLHLTGNKYNVALTMFFIPFCLFECPSNLLLKKARPSRWLPLLTVLWGTIVTLMGIDKSYSNLVGTRFALGLVEAGFFPGVVYYLSIWYPRHMLQFRVGLFFGGATAAGAFSGLLAYGISFMNGIAGLEGWSWIFIVEGMASVVVGAVSFFVLVDFPDTAHFLSDQERAYVLWKKKCDIALVGETEHFALRYVWAAFKDWQIWLHILIYMSIIGPVYGLALFLPSIINGFGFSVPITQLLTVPPYVCATIVLLIVAVWSDRIQMRFPFIYAGLCLCTIGFCINISNVPAGVKYFGTFFCVTGAYAAFPGTVSWLGNNIAGQYKRSVALALQVGIGNFAGAIASNIYRSKDAPRYVVGHGVELMFIGIGLITVPIAVLCYSRINAKRDVLQREMEEKGLKYTPEEIREQGDRSLDFRYTL